jgi:hypothetical protein
MAGVRALSPTVGVQFPAQWLHEAGECSTVPGARPCQVAILDTFRCGVGGPGRNLAHERRLCPTAGVSSSTERD